MNEQNKETGDTAEIEMKSPVSVNGALKTKESITNIVAEVISLIGSKGVTVETALFILDKSKDAVNKCTLLQSEYTP
jgi:hypothetical protein